MTNDKTCWCEFGCEERIYYDFIEFSDGLSIRIPRSVKTDKIHNCPILHYYSNYSASTSPPPAFISDDPEIGNEQLEEQGGHQWDADELYHLFLSDG